MVQRSRLILADGNRLLLEACKYLLEPEFDVIALAGDGRELLRSTLSCNPDGIVLEVSLPQLNGLDVAEQIRRKKPSIRLVFLTSNSQPQVAAAAFHRGASGYVLKHAGVDEYLAGIRTVMSGRSYLSPLVARETMEYLLREPRPDLSHIEPTPRQREILQLLAEGRQMKEVAKMLNISPGTVAFHKYGAMERLGIKSNAGLMRFALSRYLTPEHENWVCHGPNELVGLPAHSTERQVSPALLNSKDF